MTPSVSRRRVLGLGLGALAGCLSDPRERREPTEPGDDPTPAPGTTATRTTEPGCGTPVSVAWGSRDEDPAVPPCPEKPEDMDACSARAFALGLEKHRRYARAIERHERIAAVAFEAYTATVTRVAEGFVVAARLYVTVNVATPSPATEPSARADTTSTDAGSGERTEDGPENPAEWPDGIYDVSYLLAPDRQWRALGAFDAGSAIREAGWEIGCVDGI